MYISKIDDQIQLIQEKSKAEVEYLNKMKELVLTPSNHLEETILKKYLELQSVGDVARWLNNEGYRIPSSQGERKYLSNDVTEVIKNKKSDANIELKEFALRLYKKNYNATSRRF